VPAPLPAFRSPALAAHALPAVVRLARRVVQPLDRHLRQGKARMHALPQRPPAARRLAIATAWPTPPPLRSSAAASTPPPGTGCGSGSSAQPLHNSAAAAQRLAARRTEKAEGDVKRWPPHKMLPSASTSASCDSPLYCTSSTRRPAAAAAVGRSVRWVPVPVLLAGAAVGRSVGRSVGRWAREPLRWAPRRSSLPGPGAAAAKAASPHSSKAHLAAPGPP
jgi:hypothetical protein